MKSFELKVIRIKRKRALGAGKRFMVDTEIKGLW